MPAPTLYGDASLLRQGYTGQAGAQVPCRVSLLRPGSPANIFPALVLLAICFFLFSLTSFADTRPDADTLWKRAEKQAQAGDSRSAVQTYAEFADRFRRDKRYSAALLKKGECEQALGDSGAALKTWNKLSSDAATLNRDPDTAAAALVNIITCHTDAGNPASADKYRPALLRRFPAAPAAVELMTREGNAAFMAGDFALAARCRLLITLDQPAAAESALEAFIKRYPGDAAAWLELGRLQAFTLNKVADGAGALETAARSSSPIGVEARYLLCGVLVKQGKWKDAVNALEKFQADFPDSRFAAAADMSLKTCRERITKAAPAAGSQEALAVKEKLSHQQALQKAEQAYDGKGYEDANKRYSALLLPTPLVFLLTSRTVNANCQIV
ncbi:MAG: tetratricopeptide repeat protein [Lentisphaeria bacterium]|nr:tetratricopeptide repeat protein [Lentisphaeria bacterium]